MCIRDRVPTEEAKQFSAENQLLFTEASALNAENVDLSFQQLLKSIYDMVSKHQFDLSDYSGPKPSGGPTISLTPTPGNESSKNKSNCC